VIDASPPALKQMIDVFAKVGALFSPSSGFRPIKSQATASSMSTRRESGQGHSSGPGPGGKTTARGGSVELAIIGRYLLTPDIFPALRETASDRTARSSSPMG